jgi:DNA recombination protein RmuC
LKLNCPDFVLLFIPIESSFSLAVQSDHDLFSYAWDLKVVLVSPSTLLATLRTISSIWQQENQTRNAIEIARQSGALYDKFVGFVAIWKNRQQPEDHPKHIHDAMKKLSEGRGNLVAATERLKKLGAKATKELPKKMLENDTEQMNLRKKQLSRRYP